MILIGLAGKKGSGKNTVANIIKYLCPNMKCAQLAFADSLKEEVSCATGKPIRYIEENKGNFRLILQGWGTDFRRKLFGDDYWTNKLLVKISRLDESVGLIIITDVRFINEYKLIHELGGKVWRVNRMAEQDQHSSETELDNSIFDVEIDNTDSMSKLEYNVKFHLQRQKILL